MISLNLLPNGRKEVFRWRQYTKKVISNGIKLTFLLICFALPLYSIDFYLMGEIKALDIQNASSENTKSMLQLNSMEKSFKEINNAFVKINKISENQIYWGDVFTKISLNIPPNIQIFSLQVEPDGTFSISGNAKTREDALEMEKRFKESSDFSATSIPSEAFDKKEDIVFKLSGNIILDNFKKNKQ